MRLDGVAGTLEPGKRADLIVLDGNPLRDIRDLNAIRLVMKDGTLYRSADIWRAVGFEVRGQRSEGRGQRSEVRNDR
jgi:cytosine/adenosine deaminase-related metal-dependent hydrolase